MYTCPAISIHKPLLNSYLRHTQNDVSILLYPLVHSKHTLSHASTVTHHYYGPTEPPLHQDRAHVSDNIL